MLELTESLRQQQQRQIHVPEPANYDMITLTQKYNKMKPPEFLRGNETLKAKAWVLETEKIFEVFPCTEVQKILLATFTLKEEARRLWMLVRNDNDGMTWGRFKELFFEKYFPQCIQDRKVSEFEQLKQGDMTVAKYEAKFTELAQYAPHMVNTDNKKARKFEGGLDLDMFDRVGVLKLPKYVDVLDRALMSEANIAALQISKLSSSTEWDNKKQKKQKFEMTSNSMTSMNEKSKAITFDNVSRESNDIPICKECEKQHWGICRRLSGACFKCGNRGHLSKSYPQAHPNNNRPNASTTGSILVPRTNATSTAEGSNIRQGRVYTLVLENAWNTGTTDAGTTLIMCKCLCDNWCGDHILLNLI